MSEEPSMEELDALDDLDQIADSSPADATEQGSEQDTEQVETPEPETEESESEVEEPAESAVKETDDEPDTEEDKTVDGVQKRINKLTAQKHEFRRQAEEANKRLAEYEQRIQNVPQNEPKLEDFDYDESAWLNAMVDYRVDQKAAQIRLETVAERQQSEQQKALQDWDRRIKETGIQDYGPVVQELTTSMQIPPAIEKAIMSDEKGPQLAYYLGKHLDVADRIVSMEPVQAAMELGRISAKLSTAVKPKLKTKAVDPAKPVKSGSKLTKTYEDMSMEELDAIDIV